MSLVKEPEMWVYSLRFDIDELGAYMADSGLLGIRHVKVEVLYVKAFRWLVNLLHPQEASGGVS